ncbi:MAG: tRNA (N(6)-L-threonylcarbamoyladenosine(37)-C(2))-methylthiotransferase MtaB [Candidatus Fournierella pullistercoris]|uniref:Threonylcarbamoyladenosine tRNA methylthiotransferase MtaB n=1 Tax=Candidatus Allofournierella pullistercoris TaxID=2838597 RepID=A0A948WRQ9_9FIRM|nr:tRNA (N(6)-L-threonylcarbamoyladenosine(37)-C(2))-methylthiotransferase MtaB [Candidatus Fournierella pullistercoris]
MRVSFYTLGCKVNQNETGALAQLFSQNGYTLAGPEEEADVFVVNSCTVTAGGDKKSRQWLRRAKREYPGAITVLTGCYPQAFPEEAATVQEADVVMGNANRHAIIHNIQLALSSQERVVDIAAHEKGEVFEELPVERFEGHTRAFIKVQDGCNRQCAYCVIPRARGRVRSRNEASILNELKTLAAAGYKEVVLTGINLPSYGQDTGTNLTELVERCAQVEGIERIRLGSLEPDVLSDEHIVRLSKVKKLCPQFHLSLQSGCTTTLRRMRRVYTAEQYARVVEKIREIFGQQCSFTTDIIVGFPGETEEEFAESLAFVRKIGFLKVHVFPFSPRTGTPAATFPDQIPESVKAQRVKQMQTEADAVREELAKSMLGSTQSILLEKALSGSLFTGYTPLYLPVVVNAPGAQPGEILSCVLEEWDGDRCRARAAKQ